VNSGYDNSYPPFLPAPMQCPIVADDRHNPAGTEDRLPGVNAF